MGGGAVATAAATIATAISSRTKSVAKRRRPREGPLREEDAGGGCGAGGSGTGRLTHPRTAGGHGSPAGWCAVRGGCPRGGRAVLSEPGGEQAGGGGGVPGACTARGLHGLDAALRVAHRATHLARRAVALAGVEHGERDRHRVGQLGVDGGDECVEHRGLLALLLEGQLGE